MLQSYLLGIILCISGSYALYDSSSAVVDLNPSNFNRLVVNSNEIWIVEFYAPWCGHCKNLVPEYKKAAEALKGIVNVGAVNADEHKELGNKYGVSGFPTIKVFTGSKHTPYNGQRTAEGFVDAALKAAKEKAYENLGKKPQGKRSKVYGHQISWHKPRSCARQLVSPQMTSALRKLRFDSLQTNLFRDADILVVKPKIITWNELKNQHNLI